eukprot:1589962-Ditylum_brightwellii.AAC.1
MDFKSTLDLLGSDEKEGEIQSGTTINQNGVHLFPLMSNQTQRKTAQIKSYLMCQALHTLVRLKTLQK